MGFSVESAEWRGGTWKEGWEELEGVPTRNGLQGSLASWLQTPCRSLDP